MLPRNARLRSVLPTRMETTRSTGTVSSRVEQTVLSSIARRFWVRRNGKWFGGYAGLQFRLPHHDLFSAWTISNSEGIAVASQADGISQETRKSLEPLHGRPARWMDLTLDMTDGKVGGATIMDHPGNLRHPPAWHTAAMPHEFHQAPLFTGLYTLGAGEKLPFRFRILVHAGPLRKTETADRWEEFIKK